MRSASIPLFPTLLHALLCFAVLMQMLGAPVSLWQADFPGDLVKASLLEGFSLVAGHVAVSQSFARFRSVDLFMIRPSLLLSDSPFRPPLVLRPPMSLA